MRIPTRAGFRRHATTAVTTFRRRLARAQASRRLRQSLGEHARVHLGCGTVRLGGWTNVDLDRAVRPDVLVDLRAGFPAQPGMVQFVFSEHVFEHLALESGRRVLADLYRALEPGGVVRIAMPDLHYIAVRYLEGRYLSDDSECEGHEGATLLEVDSAAQLFNVALRSWGHLYLYDLAELTLRLGQAGFSSVDPQTWGESTHPELSGLERRPESRLIVEATK